MPPNSPLILLRHLLKTHFKIISAVNLHVDWHLTVHHSRKGKENNPWQGFTAQNHSYSFMLFSDSFSASSPFKSVTFRYLQFVFSISVFIHMANTQIKTTEALIFPVVIKPFGSRQYQDHILFFLYSLFFVFLAIYKSFCQCVLQAIFRLNIAPKRRHGFFSQAAENAMLLLVFIE